MRAIKLSLLVLTLGASALAGDTIKVGAQPSARVDCGRPGPGGVDCQIKRTAGTAAVTACWDLAITCNNGGVMTAHGCGKLAANAESSVVNLPVSTFANVKACDVPKAGAVKNLEVKL